MAKHIPMVRTPAVAPLAPAGAWDCHCHILPDLDDGPRTMDEAVAMVRMAAESGTRTMIATPHHIVGLYPTRAAEVLERLGELNRRCTGEGIAMNLLAGQELALSPDIPARLASSELLSLGNAGRAVLIELPPLDPPPFWRHTFFELRVRGITPVIAHAERTALVSNAELAAEMAAAGATFQVNTPALSRAGGSRRVMDGWLRRGWVACLGSDAHDLRRRPPVLAVPAAQQAWLDISRAQPPFLHPGSTVSA